MPLRQRQLWAEQTAVEYQPRDRLAFGCKDAYGLAWVGTLRAPHGMDEEILEEVAKQLGEKLRDAIDGTEPTVGRLKR